MPNYLTKEEIRQWRSSLEKITLEEFAARLGKVVEESKPTNDVVDIVMSKGTSSNSNNNISEDKNLICQWLVDDLDIREMQFYRLGLIETKEEFVDVLIDQVAKFYEQCRLDGKGDIRKRGRLDVIAHFNNWIKAVTRIKKEDESGQNNIDNTMQSIMEDLEE